MPDSATTVKTTTATATASSAFDLEQHVIHRYAGEARLQRLLWIALHATNDLQQSAYAACLAAVKQQHNVARYKELYHHYHLQQQQQQSPNITTTTTTTGRLPPYDAAWVHETESSNRHEREVLLARLQSAQAHLNKEAVRAAFTALATFYLLRTTTGSSSSSSVGASLSGAVDLMMTEAFHAAVRAKDYCTSRQQTAGNSLQILSIALHMRNYQAVREYVPRLEHTIGMLASSSSSSSSSAINNGGSMSAAAGGGANTTSTNNAEQNLSAAAVKNKVLTASAMERLASGDYAAAATKFRTAALEAASLMGVFAPPESTAVAAAAAADGTTTTSSSASATDDWDAVLAPDDVAMYAAVLTLATTSSSSSSSSSSSNDRHTALALAEHPEALERIPVLREILTSFYKRAAYHHAWQLLETHVWPILEHDMHLAQPAAAHSYYYSNDSSSGTTTTTTMVAAAPALPCGDGNNIQTHLQVLQEAIRCKAIGFYWKAYHNCPLATMAAALGPGIAGSAEELKTTILQLLKNRRHYHHHTALSTSDNKNKSDSGNTMLAVLPMDTRLDGTSHTLVRTLPDAEQDRLLATSLKLQATSTRVLDGTLSMVIRLACLEHDLVVTDPNNKQQQQQRWGQPQRRRQPHQPFAAFAASAPNGSDDDDDDDGDFMDTHMVDAAMDEMNPEDLY